MYNQPLSHQAPDYEHLQSRPNIRNDPNDPGHQYNTQNTNRGDSNVAESKYASGSFGDKPKNLQNHPKRNQNYHYTYDSYGANPSEPNQADLEYQNFHSLPAELEAVQERSLEQSQMTFKGSTFNDKSRTREENFRYRTEGYVSQEMNPMLNFSSDSMKFTMGKQGYNFYLPEFEDLEDKPRKRPQGDRNLIYQSTRNRNLSDSASKHQEVSSSYPSARTWTQFDRPRYKSGANSVESGVKPHTRDLNKTVGSFGNYNKTTEAQPKRSKQRAKSQATKGKKIINKSKSQPESKPKERTKLKRFDSPGFLEFSNIRDAILEIERLENKIKAKDKLMEIMRVRHEEIWLKFQHAQEELHKVTSEQDSRLKESQYEVERLLQKVNTLESQGVVFSRENEEYEKSEREAYKKIQELNAHISNLQADNITLAKRYQTKIETLLDKIKQIEHSSQSLLDPNNSVQLRILEDQNEELQEKNNLLSKMVQERDKRIQKHEQKLEESVRDLIDDRVNQTLQESSRNYSHKLQQYKETLKALKAENEILKMELKALPTPRQGEARPKSTEPENQQGRSFARESIAPPDTNGRYKKLNSNLQAELEVENPEDLVTRVRELISAQKTSAKFNAAVTDMVMKCAPPGYFSETPSLKESWKFIKSVMEEYMDLKKKRSSGQSEGDSEALKILKVVAEFIGAQSKGEIQGRIKQLVSENNLMDIIVSKFKELIGLDETVPLKDFDEILSDELERKRQALDT